MTVTAISISRTGHRQKSEQQQQQQKQASYKLPTLVPCAPTRTMCTHSYLAHPLVPCAPTRTLYPPTRTLHTNSDLVPPTRTLCTHSYLVHPLIPCAPTRTLCNPLPDESQRGSAFHPEMLPRGKRRVCVLLILTMWMTSVLPSPPLP